MKGVPARDDDFRLGARAGIGYLILQANFALDLAGVFSLLWVLGVLGVTLSLCIRAIEKKVCFWARRGSE